MPPWIDVPQAPGAQRTTRAKVRDQARPGFEIRNALSSDEAELLIYDEIDAWWGVAAGDVISELATITAPKLRVRLNSPGGSVFEGLAIANALRSHPADVTVQVDGLAASIASVIAMAADRLVMMPNSMLMVHDASGLCIGDASDMQQMGGVLDKISDNIAGAYAAKAGGTAADWRQVMKNETWYLPDEAVQAGLADEAIDAAPAAEEPAMSAHWDLTAYGYAGPPKPAAPKPGPPPAKAQADEETAETTLTIRIDAAVGEQMLDDIRRLVKSQQSETASVEPSGTGPGEATAAGSESSPVAPGPAAPTEPEAQPEPEWADAFAHLTTPPVDDWSAAFAHLTQTPASSATDA